MRASLPLRFLCSEADILEQSQVIADIWEKYMKLLEGGMGDGLVEPGTRTPDAGNSYHEISECILTILANSEAMDQVGAKRYCCRRMLMTHVDLIEKLLQCVFALIILICSGSGRETHG